ncbi:MAG TPA: hypothetical protein VGQ42_10385 [Candidatus Dormibacteraeota bacterium]|jgi:hypothetical protein|nr:hypothetical protein [Candidatus Dormibacteraeota bacterium]
MARGLVVALVLGAAAASSSASLGARTLSPPLQPAAAALTTTSLDAPTMQPVNAPARIARVAEIPGTDGHEAWAIGYTSAADGRWAATSSLGQVVFLHYGDSSGWQISDAPRLPDGSVSHARLFALAIAQGGEGWAVGEGGALVHLPAGGDRWTVVPDSATGVTLESVSLAGPAGHVAGFASGAPHADASGQSQVTVLELPAGSSSWNLDTSATLIAAAAGAASADLPAIAAVSPSEAWATTGDSSSALYVLHDVGGSWSRVTTGSAMFDSAPVGATSGGSSSQQNQAANGSGIAADGNGAWVVGRLQPTDNSHPLGDTLTGDRSRPFAVHFHGSVDTYCPAVETAGTNNSTSTSSACGGGTLPLAAFGLTSVSMLGGGEVFAGGMGLFHFTGGHWQRETDSVGFVTSLSMARPDEGWVAGTGSNAISGGPFSETLAAGHWTRSPTIPAVARWPEPDREPVNGVYATPEVEAVALAPDASGEALSVGADGSRLRYLPGFGWNLLARGSYALHALAWPAPASGWAVGDSGTLSHFDGSAWFDGEAPRAGFDAPPDDLFGIAFAGPGTGYAVGANGSILDYSGGTWRRDAASGALTRGTLYAVAAVPGGAVAVGDGGVVLVNHGGAWGVDTAASQQLASISGQPGPMYAAASLPDGTVAVGGAGGVVLVGRPGAMSRMQPGVDGTVLALGLTRDTAGSLQVIASVSAHSAVKYVNGAIASTGGWLYLHDASGWHDIELDHQLTMWTSTDTAAPHDPVLGIAMDAQGSRGWAVGGYPALTLDEDNHSYQRGQPSGSIYRVDLVGDPTPPSSLLQMPDPPQSGFSFAFLGDSACATGLCSAAMGSGSTADVVLQQAQAEIGYASSQPGGPGLALFGGNMRRTGLPEELDQFKRMMGSWTVPFFAAMGRSDLVGLNTTDVVPGAPSQAVGTTNQYYQQAFAGQPAPWGSGPAPAGVTPVAVSAATSNMARTHYAFDYKPVGLPGARFVVLNDSEGTLANTTENPNETQDTWLTQVLTSSGGLPVIVVANAPNADPRGTAQPMGASGATFTSDVTTPTNPVSGFFASGIAGNMNYSITGPISVPAWISGGAGSPLEGTRNPAQGYYHSWMLVTVDPSHRSSTGQATVTVKAMPVLESVAMRVNPINAAPGTALPAGNAAVVHALGRAPDGGLANLNGAAPDPSQAKANYIDIPSSVVGASTCTPGLEADNCRTPYTVQPYHRFWSEDPTIAQFAQPCPSASAPALPCIGADGQPVPDDQDGFLCGMNPGTTWIDVLVGLHRARQQITVSANTSGPCNQHPLPGPGPGKTVVVNQVVKLLPAAPQPQAATIPAPGPQTSPVHRFFHQTLPNNIVPAVVPPPVPVLAVGPPLPAAGTAAKKEEEREKAFEQSKESSGGQTHQAVAYAGPQNTWDARPVAIAGAAGLAMFVFAAAWAATRRRPEAAMDWRRWE